MRQRVVPDLDIITEAVAIVLQNDVPATRREVGVRELRVVGADLFVERHYAALTNAAENWQSVASVPNETVPEATEPSAYSSI